MTACMVGCSDNDEPVVPQPPTPDPDNGEVSFVIDNENGSGTGTTDSPAEVEKGETLNMVISQKSKYTDSDGSVFECEPKATIELFAKLDTVYVKDKNQLTSVQEKPEVTSSQSGTNPIRNAINQKFLDVYKRQDKYREIGQGIIKSGTFHKNIDNRGDNQSEYANIQKASPAAKVFFSRISVQAESAKRRCRD